MMVYNPIETGSSLKAEDQCPSFSLVMKAEERGGRQAQGGREGKEGERQG